MRIIIATGIYPPQIGGPAQYAKNLEIEFKKLGHQVAVLVYGRGHFLFFLKMLVNLPGADFVLALDTFSVALPAVAAAKLFNKKIIIRTGGDFLWESYVERTGDLVLLRHFYQTSLSKLNPKEKIIYKLTKWVLNNCRILVFSTDWQKNIWLKPYNLREEKLKIIENYYG